MRDYSNNRMLPADELKKIKRRLPSYGRSAIRRMENDVRNARAIDEGKWRVIGVEDVQERYRLRTAYERAESYLTRVKANGANLNEAAPFILERDEARDALTAFEEDRESRLSQLRDAKSRTEGGLLERCKRFLSGHSQTTFKELVAPVTKGDLSKVLIATRYAIASKNADIANLDLAPVTLAEATAHIDHDIEKFARAGAPDTYMALRFLATNSNTRRHGFTRWPEVWTGINGRKINDGFSLVFWALKDLIRDKLVAEAKQRIESSAFPPIAIADRAPREAQLRAELLDLERTEEAIVAALQAKGDANVVRRYNADPRALLGIEIVTTEPTHGKSGDSLAQYTHEPKMEAPKGQSLPRSSKWVNQGARNTDSE
ncbi:hypothetical protein GGQ85_000749 [Nitrobacter vulgaris]|uniref:hypothetical protein n=1 Tax=Nitrobacter vulgaris TaxID=29421 RepID=UPI002854A9FF|nr:hypothetical protein [Nitrobacter vulgaris]MDR6303068.1 hypothetical protein [Nitrobacter vulgaris]